MGTAPSSSSARRSAQPEDTALPRDLEDVADYFLPRASGRAAAPPTPAAAPPVPTERPAALPILAVPMRERDVVRAAFVWNLAVEAARLGRSATVLVPEDGAAGSLWPGLGTSPLGAEVLPTAARDLGDLNRAALDVAVERAAESDAGGLVVVQVPPPWLRDAEAGRALLRWVLLFSSPDPADLREAYSLAKRVLLRAARCQLGLTIHGARRLDEAERAYRRVADVAARHLGRRVESYGLLVDDLHVYRAIVSRRPIGLEHPQSRAARALRDVTRLLLEDARKSSLG